MRSKRTRGFGKRENIRKLNRVIILVILPNAWVSPCILPEPCCIPINLPDTHCTPSCIPLTPPCGALRALPYTPAPRMPTNLLLPFVTSHTSSSTCTCFLCTPPKSLCNLPHQAADTYLPCLPRTSGFLPASPLTFFVGSWQGALEMTIT